MRFWQSCFSFEPPKFYYPWGRKKAWGAKRPFACTAAVRAAMRQRMQCTPSKDVFSCKNFYFSLYQRLSGHCETNCVLETAPIQTDKGVWANRPFWGRRSCAFWFKRVPPTQLLTKQMRLFCPRFKQNCGWLGHSQLAAREGYSLL